MESISIVASPHFNIGTGTWQIEGYDDGVKESGSGTGQNTNSKVTVVIGAQWGDEGKGKIVDYLAVNADLICRCQGGSNAEHAVVLNGQVYHFRLLPAGFLNKNALCVIGNGVVVNTPFLMKELESLENAGHMDWAQRLVISDRAHLVFDFHKSIDVLQELQRKGNPLGTIKQGVGPAYASKVFRNGIRCGDLTGDFEVFAKKFSSMVNVYESMFPDLKVNLEEELAVYAKYAEKLRPVIKDTISVIHEALKNNKIVLVEGAQGSMLDIDFGTYPFVTSSNTTVGGVCTGLGIPPSLIGNVIGVIKAYSSRYGTGPFPTHLNNSIGTFFEDTEIVTPPPRKIRCGWLDLVAIKYTHKINGYSEFALTKLDTLDTLEAIKVGVGYMLDGRFLDSYPSQENELNRVEVEYVTLPGWLTSTQAARSWEELPEKAKDFIRCIEKHTGVLVKWIGVGRERDALIVRSEFNYI